jgi:stress response protein YsnF
VSASSLPLKPTSAGDDDIQILPVIDERYTISKKDITENFTVEKRMIEGIATIKVPVKYEEIYVNGKKFASGVSLDNAMSSLKDAVTNKKERSEDKVRRKKAALKGDLIPVVNDDDGETEKVLPLFGEEIIVKKRMRKVGEAVITKRKVTENKKFQINTKGEKVMIRYPDGTERMLESTASAPSLANAA